MGNMIWLASYPKSGNTWMRVFLTNYLRNGDEPADINKLEGGPIASARFWFDEWAGIEASALNDTMIERLRPDVYRCMANESKDVIMMKVHDAWSLTDLGEPLFPPDITKGVVYILRNPLDMAGSCANHWGISIEKAVSNLCDPNFENARSTKGGLTDQLRQRLGSWSSHVSSWIDRSGLPVHIVRYEDLLKHPQAAFGKVARFCGLPFDEARVRKAVAFSSFSELQKQEREKGFRERSASSSGQFFRKGREGAWRDELSSDLFMRLIDSLGTTMKRFGYLDEKDERLKVNKQLIKEAV